VRQAPQKEFHQAMLIACLVAIFKGSFDRRQQEIMDRYFQGARLEQEILVVTSRGMGKTWSVAMFVAALLMCVPCIDVAVFAQGQKSSDAVITLFLKFLKAHPRGGDIIIAEGHDHILLRGPRVSGRRLCTGCLRGVLPRQVVSHASWSDNIHPTPINALPTPAAAGGHRAVQQLILPNPNIRANAVALAKVPSGCDEIVLRWRRRRRRRQLWWLRRR
jgi:hypothetical protein